MPGKKNQPFPSFQKPGDHMKKKMLFGFLLAAVLAFTLSSPGLAQKAQPDQITASSAVNPAATSPWFVSWVDKTTSADLGAYPSVAYNSGNGLPYISYYESTNGNLMLASPKPNGGSNCGVGGNWWCRVVDGNGSNGSSNDNVGTYSSIASWRGNVGLIPVWKLGFSYHDITNDALKYAVWTEDPFNASWDFVTISAGSVFYHPGTYTSLKFTPDGNPVIAYYAYSSVANTSYLKLAQKVTSGGNCGVGTDAGKWQCDTVDSATGVGLGKYASLDLRYDGAVYLAYYDEILGNLKYAYYGGFGPCGDGYICSTVDSVGDVGLFASISAPKSTTDLPRIAYYDKTNGKLKYAVVSGDCGGAWCKNNVDSIGAGIIGNVGISMALDKDGYPIIAYENAHEDLAPSMLNIARPAPAVGELIGNCGDPPQGYLFQYWQCDTLDSAGYGLGNVNVAAYTSVAVSPNGLATIAYFESDDYNLTTSLKVAFQRFQIHLPLIMK
jgi:hypothetical protein